MGLPVNATTQVATSQFVAVEFDTYPNSWDPKVWDPITGSNASVGTHVGINISSLTSVRYQKWLSNVTGGGGGGVSSLDYV
ncbi:putative legume lectin domain, concanavalin A-like lectin/glucanase domain superfamily [Helianthus annuus]|nr:putative legume lectin domain, concanavalin A-like lectin/glucanase domain superfamily [Helianthus annuus]